MNQPSDLQIKKEGNPWYKEPWGWIVIGPLFFIVFACFVTVTIAFIYSDDHVHDEYVKSGKHYEKDFKAENNAKKLGILADLDFRYSVKEIRLYLSSSSSFVFDDQVIQLDLVHPVKKAMDSQREFRLLRQGVYVAKYMEELTGRWYVRVAGGKINEDTTLWRLSGEIDLNQSSKLILEP